MATITRIIVNYPDHDCFGHYTQRSDSVEHIDREDILKAFSVLFGMRVKGEFACAHFNFSDGSNEAVWVDSQGWTWRHDCSANSSDAPVPTRRKVMENYILERAGF